MMLVRLVARPMLAAIFVVEGLKALKDPEPLVPAAEPLTEKFMPAVKRAVPKPYADRIPDDAKTLVRINGAVQAAAGLTLATGRFPRLSAAALVASLVPTTLAGHAFWERKDPADQNAQRVQFLKNLGLSGGLLLAAVDTAGKPGLWWRTRHGASEAKKATRRAAQGAAKDARRKAKALATAARAKLPHP